MNIDISSRLKKIQTDIILPIISRLKKIRIDIILPVIFAIAFAVVSSYLFSIFPPAVRNIGPLITVIIPSLASILAIIITLTLVAVQLSSQNFGDNVPKLFMSYKNGYFWGLIFIYLITITYGLFILNNINLDENATVKTISLILIDIFFSLTIYCLFLLIPYTRNTMVKLEPEKLVDQLLKDLNQNFIEKLSKNKASDLSKNKFKEMFGMYEPKTEQYPGIDLDEDPMIPILDVIIGAIKNEQTNTVKACLDEIYLHINELTKKEIIDKNDGKKTIFNDDNWETFLFYFMNMLEKLEKVAISNFDSRTMEILINISIKVSKLMPNKNPESSDIHLRFYGHIYTDIIHEKLETALFIFIVSLANLIDYFSQNAINDPIDIDWTIRGIKTIKYFNKIRSASLEKKEISIHGHIRLHTQLILSQISKSGMIDVIKEELESLVYLGIKYVKDNPDYLIEILDDINLLFEELFYYGFSNSLDRVNIRNSFQKRYIGEYFFNYPSLENNIIAISESVKDYYFITQQQFDGVIINIMDSLKAIGEESITKDKYEIKVGYKITFDKLAIYSPVSNKKELILIIIELIEKIGINYSNKDSYRRTGFINLDEHSEDADFVIDTSIKYLCEITHQLLKKDTELYINGINSIQNIGSYGNKNETENAILESNKCLESIIPKIIKKDCSHVPDLFKYLTDSILDTKNDDYISHYWETIKKISPLVKEDCSNIFIDILEIIKSVENNLRNEKKDSFADEIATWIKSQNSHG